MDISLGDQAESQWHVEKKNNLRGMKLIVYIGMLANRDGWDVGKLYQIPAELAATVDRYQADALDAGHWIQDRGIEPLRPMIIQQRDNCAIPSTLSLSEL